MNNSLLPYLSNVFLLLSLYLSPTVQQQSDINAPIENQQQQQLTLSAPSSRDRIIGSPTSGFYKVDACMLSIEASVCDPDGVLSSDERQRIESKLSELETTTKRNVESNLFTYRGQCPESGLTLKMLIFNYLVDPENTDQKILDLHWKYTLAHPCQRTAVIMLSPGPDYRNRNAQFSSNLYPGAVWSKFYAVSSRNANITPTELVGLYRNSVYPIRRGQFADALESIVNQIRNRVR